jgi:hypothetical protein
MDRVVLVDTSAWIEFFRSPDSPVGNLIDELLSHDLAAICGVVYAELLQGTRTVNEYSKLDGLLKALPLLAPGDSLWSKTAEAGFLLRRKGISGVGIPDLLIAVTAWDNDVGVLTLDEHFQSISQVRSLRLIGHADFGHS